MALVNILIVTYSIVAAIIGAGFASGQEMLLYFVVFNKYGILGIVITTFIFMLFIYAVLSLCVKARLNEYEDFIGIFKSYLASRIIKIITLAFSFAVYSAMISASGEILFNSFGLPRSIGTLLCTVFSVVLLSVCGDKVFTLNAMLGIILVLLITFSTMYMLFYREFHTFSSETIPAINSGLIYSGYNLVSLSPVLVTLSKRLKSQTDTIAVSISAGVVSFIIMGLTFWLISIYANKINLGELPMLTLAKRQNTAFAGIYTFVLSSAIMTTLISSGGGLCDALKIKSNPLKLSLLSAVAYFVAGFGFSNLINTLYRVCGIVGLFVCILIIYNSLKCKTKKNS